MYTLDTLPFFGWLLISVVGLLMGFAALWLAWLGRRPRFPEGPRAVARQGRYKVTVVMHPLVDSTKRQDVAKACARAVWAAGSAWQHSHGFIDGDHHHVCVYFAGNYTFDESPFKEVQAAAAYLDYTGASVGSGIPMAVIRHKHKELVLETGEPVIHEMTHLLLGEFSKIGVNRAHDHQAWEAVGGKTSAQAKARAMFLRTA